MAVGVSSRAGRRRVVARVALPLILLIGCLAFFVAQLSPRPGPRPRQRYASSLFDPSLAPEKLEGASRDAYQKPAALVQNLRLKPGDRVADIGAGTGYLMSYLSRAVGPSGVVYAEEIQPEFVAPLELRARGLGNVRVILGTPEDPGLPRGEIDCFVLLTVYHEVRRPVHLLRHLARASASGARLAIVDFDERRGGDPPAPVGHAVAEADVLVEAAAAGWVLDRRVELFSSQFFLIFRLSE